MTQPQVAEQQFDLDAIFDQSGGGDGSPSFAWPEDGNRNPQVGGSISGTITNIFVTVVKDAQTKQPKLDRRGRQMPQVNITIQTNLRNWEGCKKVPLNDPSDPNSGPKPASEDTGLRRIYAKYLMLEAIAKAIKGSTQTSGGPRIGAQLAVRVSGLRGVAGQLNPLVEYQAKYEPPAPTDAAWDQAMQSQQAPQQPAFAPSPQAYAPPAQPQQAFAPQGQPAGDPWAAASQSSEPPF